jgi:hypothetical protein
MHGARSPLSKEPVVVTAHPPGTPGASAFVVPAVVHLPASTAAALRDLCLALLTDLPAFNRKALLARMSRLRRADDRWQLRDALFEVIAQVHGKGEARARLAALDEQLK